MKKKIILLSTTVIFVLAGLFLYNHFSNVGSSPPASESKPTTPPIRDTTRSDTEVRTVELPQNIGVGPTENLVYVRTNKKGRVIQKFGFVERMESLPGRLKIRRPWIQIFSKDDRVTEITALTGTVDVEDTEGQMQIPNSGYLNDVRIKMYKLPKDTAEIPIPLGPETPEGQIIEMEAQLSEAVRFDREISRLESSGDCVVTSKLFSVTGTGLLLAYDQNNELLQNLDLRQVKRLRLARKNLRAETKPTDAKNLKTQKSGKKKKESSRNQPATYHFTLIKNVVIEQPAKQEKLLADRIDVFADFDPNQFKSGSQDSPVEDENRKPAPEKANLTLDKEKSKDIFLTCDGPLRISLAKDYKPTAKADRMILIATGEPAQIWKDGKLTLEANRIQHDQTNELSVITGSIERPVRMSLSDQQWATAQRKVVLDQKKSLGTLYGPGQIEYLAEPNEEPAIIHYQNELLVKFTELAGSLTESDDQKPTFVEWISFQGPLRAESKDGRVQADKKGKLVFFIPPTTPGVISGSDQKKNKVGAGPIQFIELWGNVIAEDKNSNINVTDHLEAAFEYIDLNTSRIRSVRAWGPLRAEDPNYIIEATAPGDILDLTFDTKDPPPKTKPVPAVAKTQKAQGGWGFDQLMSGGNLLEAIVKGKNSSLKFTSKQDQYQVIGDRVDGDAKNQIWKIIGKPAQVIGLAEQGKLEGETITADLLQKFCHIAGRGTMDTVIQGDLLDREVKNPMLMHIDWQDGVTYNLADGKVTANNVDARMESTDNTKQITYLQCPMVTIDFDPNSADTKNQLYAQLDMQTFLAHGGKIQVRREEYDPNTNRLLNDLEMLTQRLHFDNQNRILRAAGSGLVEVSNYRLPPSEKDRSQDSSVNQALTNMFGPSGPGRTLVRFGREMRYEQEPNQLLFTGGVALDHLPLDKELTPDPAQLAQLAGLKKLDCRELILILDDSKDTRITKPGPAENPSGVQQAFGALRRVTALDRVFTEVILKNGTRRFIAGQKLSYDNLSKEILIEGNDSVPAYLDQIQCRSVKWNYETGEFKAILWGQSIVAGQP
jgi:hypothetical protein